MLKKMVGIVIGLLCGSTVGLTACGETIEGSLSLDDHGADRLTWEHDGQREELKKTDPVFNAGITTLPTYTAAGNSELPPEIKTVQAEKAGYHFSGWAHLVNGKPSKEKPLEDFSQSRMPYSPVTYQAILKKYLTVTFHPIDRHGQNINIANVILQGDEYYEGALINHRKLEDEVLSVLTARKVEADEGKTEGSFIDIHTKIDFGEEKPLTAIELPSANVTYYVIYDEYPTLKIFGTEEKPEPDPNPDTPLVEERIKTGAPISKYKPAENPTKENAVFEKWYEASNPDGEIFFDKEVMLAGGMTIYPKFLNAIELTFETTDEDVKITNSPEYDQIMAEKGEVRVLQDRDLDPSLLASAVKLGWHFEGWYYDVNNTGKYDEDEDPLFPKDENVKVRVPPNLPKLNLKPYLTRDSADQATLYVDLGPYYHYIDEDSLKALGLKPAPQIPKTYETTEIRVWSIDVAAGQSLATYLDIAQYQCDTQKLFIEDFTTVIVPDHDFTDIAHIETTEPLPEDPAQMHMPDKNYAVRLVAQKLFTLKIHRSDEIISVSINERDNVLTGYDDYRLKDYLSPNQTGWSTSENGDPIGYPFTIDNDDIALYPLFD